MIEETNVEHPLAYSAIFTLNKLKQLGSSFASTSNISEIQTIFENIVINQKISIKYQREYIILKVSIKKKI